MSIEQPAAPTRSRRREVVVVGVVILVLAVAGIGAYWVLNPNALPPVGGRQNVPSATLDEPTTLFVANGPRDAVTLRGAHANTRVLPPDAANVRLLFCSDVVDPPPVGERRCVGEEKFDGRAFGTNDMFYVVVEPTAPVRVEIDGVTVSYRTGVRFGDERTGIRIVACSGLSSCPAR